MAGDEKPKHPGGRPSKLTPELRDQVCQLLEWGLTQEQVAAFVGVSTICLRKWLKRPEFVSAYARVQANGLGRSYRCMHKAIDAGDTSAARWYLAVTAPHRWTERRADVPAAGDDRGRPVDYGAGVAGVPPKSDDDE